MKSADSDRVRTFPVAVAFCCLVMVCLLRFVDRESAIDPIRVTFHTRGPEGAPVRPVEGDDPFTPKDRVCDQHGYDYRVHLTGLRGAWCAIFFEDELLPNEGALTELGVRSVVRFVVTPVSQVANNPPPYSTRARRRLTPQQFVRRGEEIDALIAKAWRHQQGDDSELARRNTMTRL